MYLRCVSVGEAEAVLVAAGAFDLALASRVIRHVPDHARVARELVRVLHAPQGRLKSPTPRRFLRRRSGDRVASRI
ncbi:methyltransferase domain-containing protein [Streptomyces sp. NPDC019396]|uniref:methyltransferase domain-containing protein n=1 Tax=Streptomyces sp. NPDC019396 TaxID=3154687 RepID=UPI0034055F1E